LLKSRMDELGKGEEEDTQRRAQEWESYTANLGKGGAAYRQRIAEQTAAIKAASSGTAEQEKVPLPFLSIEQQTLA
jgi:hypothetical protein